MKTARWPKPKCRQEYFDNSYILLSTVFCEKLKITSIDVKKLIALSKKKD